MEVLSMKWQEILSGHIKKPEIVERGMDIKIKQIESSREYAYTIKLITQDISLSSENLRWIICALKGEDMPTFMKLMTRECIFSGKELLERFKNVRVFREDNCCGERFYFPKEIMDRASGIYIEHRYQKVWAEMIAIEILDGKVVRECNVDLSQ